MTPEKTFIIVGAGLAGAKAAETLRAEGFEGRVILIGDEPERPYERPPLSKDYLRGESREKPYVHAADFYARARDRAAGPRPRVTGLDRRPEVSSLEASAFGYDASCSQPAPTPPA